MTIIHAESDFAPFDDTPTVRRHPRSMSEAFKDVRADSGDWVRMPRYDVESAGHRCVFILALAGLAWFLVWAVVQIAVRFAS